MRVAFFDRLPVRLAGIILLLGFIAVPLVSELKRRAAEQIVLQQAELQSATATIAVVEGLQNELRSVETTVRYIARDLEDRELTPAEVDRILNNVMAGTPNFCEFSISFEPHALGPDFERFGHYLSRAGGQFVARDLADPGYRYWTRDWYGATLGRRELTWSEPFFDQGGANANVVRVSAPFFRNVNGRRSVAGVVAAGLELGWVRQLTEENEFFDTGYVMIFSRAGRLITHPNPKYVFAETMDSLAQKTNTPELAQIYQRVSASRQGSLSYLSNALHARIHENYKPVQIGGWGVVVGYKEAEFLQQVSAFRWITMVSLALTLALLLVIVLVTTLLALRPLARLTTVSQEITLGNLDCEIIPTHRNDEIGLLTRSFLLMQETLKKNRLLEASVRERTAEVAAANVKLRAENLERRWANQALEHQRRYDQLIINSITDLVLVLTKARNISRVNPAVLRLTGRELTELIDTPLSRIVRLVEEPRAAGSRTVDPLVHALNEGRDLRDLPATIEDRHGRPVAVRFTLFPLRDRDKVVGGIVILQEVRTQDAKFSP
jgi:sigma-B regulation protein RsbU (phosphoserine phosphatase)